MSSIKLKVFYCTDFEGHYPVGAAAIVVAKDVDDACHLLKEKLRAKGLDLRTTDDVIEINTDHSYAKILLDGDY